MIFQRALLRELGNLVAAVFAVLFAITLTSVLVRVLESAVGGKLPTGAIVATIGFTAINYLPILLAISLFIAILMALSRAYRDSEMVVWFSSGLPLTAWIRPVLKFTVPFVAVIAVLSFFLTPWAQEKNETYRRQLAAQEDISHIAPGVFRESSNADRVFFVEAVPNDPQSVQNIFVSFRQHGRLGVMVSKHGYLETTPNGDRFAVLLDGRRYEGTPGTPEYRVMDFERYSVRIEAEEVRAGEVKVKARPTLELATDRNPGNLAELLWRIGVPLVALVLPLLAIPLAFVNPRASRSVNLLVAVFVYMVYTNLLSIAQSMVEQAQLRFEVGWWIVHAGMLAVLVFMFYWRMSLRPLRWPGR